LLDRLLIRLVDDEVADEPGVTVVEEIVPLFLICERLYAKVRQAEPDDVLNCDVARRKMNILQADLILAKADEGCALQVVATPLLPLWRGLASLVLNDLVGPLPDIVPAEYGLRLASRRKSVAVGGGVEPLPPLRVRASFAHLADI